MWTGARAIAAAGLLGIAATAGPARGATEQLTPTYRGFVGLTAYGGHVVWSQFDSASHQWSLQEWHAGRQSRLPVPAREVPFDSDAGPDAAGRPVLVYSRCAIEPTIQPSGDDDSPDWGGSRGCHVYELRLAPGAREHLLRAVFEPERSDTTPTIWRGRLAFARRVFHGTLATHPRIMVTSSHGLLRLARGSIFGSRRPTGGVTSFASALDLGPHGLALLWTTTDGLHPERQLLLDSLTGLRHRLIHFGGVTEGECAFDWPASPNATRSGVTYIRHRSDFISEREGCGPLVSTFVSVTAGSKRRRQTTPPGLPLAMARDGVTTYWVRDDSQGGKGYAAQDCVEKPGACALMRTDP
jgi:hypothetical protein